MNAEQATWDVKRATANGKYAGRLDLVQRELESRSRQTGGKNCSRRSNRGHEKTTDHEGFRAVAVLVIRRRAAKVNRAEIVRVPGIHLAYDHRTARRKPVA